MALAQISNAKLGNLRTDVDDDVGGAGALEPAFSGAPVKIRNIFHVLYRIPSTVSVLISTDAELNERIEVVSKPGEVEQLQFFFFFFGNVWYHTYTD